MQLNTVGPYQARRPSNVGPCSGRVSLTPTSSSVKVTTIGLQGRSAIQPPIDLTPKKLTAQWAKDTGLTFPVAAQSDDTDISKVLKENSPDSVKGLSNGQFARLLNVTQTLLNRAQPMHETLEALNALDQVQLGAFNAKLSDIRAAVLTTITKDMHDPIKFPIQKIYHTECHAQEMYKDVAARYEGSNLKEFFATLAFVHDMVQGSPPPAADSSDIPTNETQTVNEFVKILDSTFSSLPFISKNLNGLKMLTEAVIVQGTYLVGFKEAEGLFSMQLLESISKTSSDDSNVNKSILQLKPVFEALAVLSLGDIHRVSFTRPLA